MPDAIPRTERLLTQDQAAELCGLHPHTLIRARRAGELPFQKFGRAIRIREGDLNAWIADHTEGGDA